MRVLLVNAFHYLKGGVERTYFDESRWLSAAGHDIGHMAIRHPENLPSPTSKFFAPEADFGITAPLLRQIGQLPRAIWSKPAEKCMEALLQEFRPDIAHVHAPSRYLTPSVLRPLERAGVPIVMTLHDFKPWCTNRILMAHGEACERCLGGRHWKAFTTGCVQGSHLKSAVGAVEAYWHDGVGAYRGVKLWIAPSSFVFQKALHVGLKEHQIRILKHGVENSVAASAGAEVPDERYVFFSGRLSLEKGVKLLPAVAAAIAPVKLLVAGDGPLRGDLEHAATTHSNLQLLGHLSDSDLAAYRARAALVVIPSLFYEHFCYAAGEAMLDARPIVASRIGAIPELVEPEKTGLLVEPGDVSGFAGAVRSALEDSRATAWGEEGRRRIREVSDPEKHVSKLLEIYGSVAS